MPAAPLLLLLACLLPLRAAEVIDLRARILADDFRLYCQAIGLDASDPPPWSGGEVVELRAGSPAKLAGLEIGDVILTWNELPFQDEPDLRALRMIALRQGREARLTLLRFGEHKKIRIPCMSPEADIGVACSFAVDLDRDQIEPALARLLDREEVAIEAEIRPFFHAVPPWLVNDLRDWLAAGDRDPNTWMQAFAAWYPLVIQQRWEEAQQRWRDLPPLRDDLPASWQTWLRYLDAVCRGDQSGALAQGFWYHLRHYPHPLQLPALGQPLFKDGLLNEALRQRRAMAGRPARALLSRLPPLGQDAGPARRYLRALLLAMFFDIEKERAFTSPFVTLADQRAQCMGELRSLEGASDIDPRLRQAAFAFCRLREGSMREALDCLQDWQSTSPYAAQLLARCLLLASSDDSLLNTREAFLQRSFALRLFIPEADLGLARLAPAYDSPASDYALHWLLGSNRRELLPLLWTRLHEQRDGLRSIESELLLSKTVINNMAWDFCTETGFDGEGLLELYRRELLRATIDQVPAYLADTVAALDMAIGDRDAALVWQQAAVDLTPPNQQESYIAHLNSFKAGRPLPRQTQLWEDVVIDGGMAGKLDSEWRGTFHYVREPWTVDGWMIDDLATGAWSFSKHDEYRVTGHYFQGSPLGPWEIFDAAGRLLASGLYLQTPDFSDPRRIGWWRFRDYGSMEQFIGPFAQGRPTGRWWLVDAQGKAQTARPWTEIQNDPTMRRWVEKVLAPMPPLPPPFPEGNWETGIDP